MLQILAKEKKNKAYLINSMPPKMIGFLDLFKMVAASSIASFNALGSLSRAFLHSIFPVGAEQGVLAMSVGRPNNQKSHLHQKFYSAETYQCRQAFFLSSMQLGFYRFVLVLQLKNGFRIRDRRVELWRWYIPASFKTTWSQVIHLYIFLGFSYPPKLWWNNLGWSISAAKKINSRRKGDTNTWR